MATKKQEDSGIVEVKQVDTKTVTVRIVGTAPLIMNRMSEKARQQLLLGAGKKTAAEKAGQAKHDPLYEFRSAPYRMINEDAPTLLGFPSSAFKAAMETAALETPGAKKTQIGRLISVPWSNVAVYGEPRIICSVTRSADMAKTPDVRTRAILPEWACEVTCTFVTPTITLPTVVTLLANAGVVSGIGDWRQEKGAGSFGSFRIAQDDDAEFARIKQTGGRSVQEAAMEDPIPFDEETKELLSWFNVEVRRRGLKVAA